MLLFFVGCTKQVQPLTDLQKEQNAISELSKIVGNNARISIIKKDTASKIQSNSTDTISSPVSIEEFKKDYNLFNSSSLFKGTGIINVVKDTTGFVTFDDGPAPKNYQIRFSSITGQNLILNYTLNNNMAQNPNVNIVGLPFGQATQSNVSNYNYNPFLGTTNFTITVKFTVRLTPSSPNGGYYVYVQQSVDFDFVIYGSSRGQIVGIN